MFRLLTIAMDIHSDSIVPYLQCPFTTAGSCGKVLQIVIYASFKVWDLGVQEIVIVIETGTSIKLHRMYWGGTSSELSLHLKIISGNAVLSSCLTAVGPGYRHRLLSRAFIRAWDKQSETQATGLCFCGFQTVTLRGQGGTRDKRSGSCSGAGQGRGGGPSLGVWLLAAVCAFVDLKTCLVSRVI